MTAATATYRIVARPWSIQWPTVDQYILPPGQAVEILVRYPNGLAWVQWYPPSVDGQASDPIRAVVPWSEVEEHCLLEPSP